MLWLDYYWHKVLKRPYTLFRRVDKGRGQPVIFLHGIASNGDAWRSVAEMLDEKKYRVVVLDLLGFGDSPRPDWLEYSVEDHAKSVIASLRKLRIYKPAIIVGHSMGSLVAAHIAQEYPRRVKRLILYQMPIYANSPHLKDFRRQAYFSAFKFLSEHPKITLWYARVLGRTASSVAGFMLNEETWQPFELSLKNTIMQQKSLANLRHLKMPVDVVYGKYDMFVMKRNLQYFFRPSKHVHFYEVADIHRVSLRSKQLMYDLITQPPDAERIVDSKYAKLVDMRKQIVQEVKPVTDIVQKPHRLAWLGIIISLLLLGSTAHLAKQGISHFEQTVFTSINNIESHELMTVIAKMCSDLVWVAVLLVLVGLAIPKTRKLAWQLTVLAGGTFVFAYIVEKVVERMRPGELLPLDTVQRVVQDGAGYPSTHMAIATVLFLGLWPRLSVVMRVAGVLFLLLVGWSRMFLGVHLPLDIIGGFACALFVYSVFRLIPHKILKNFWL